ncbi:hypothetical protein B0J11DRAFT_181007 [Dendryphion nanum]|uniref:Uncharacterized protein n=1 Tax=Dendryphion nanum TaxID=256645 RepID=A0A9P9I9J9_9PLEO|nr:hypothetical protein B0J11DRAFT_181007 [Dendryphion nanum]
MNDYEEAILFTYALLESRLDRLEYVLGGNRGPPDQKPKTLPERIQKIERSLKELSERTSLLNDVEQLISNHSDLLSKPTQTDPNDDTTLSPAQKCTIVVERAPGFATTASQLKALNDQQIPQTDGFAKLAKLRPRIAEAEDRHLQQALQISLLRRRSGLLVARVKQIHLLGQGRCWVEWHKRLMDQEKAMVRTEFRLKQDGEDEQSDQHEPNEEDQTDEEEEEYEEDEEDEEEDDEL